MKNPLYTPCELCHGTLTTRAPAMVDGLPVPGGKPLTGPLPVGSDCPCLLSKTPGYAAVGLTLGQVDAIRDDRDGLLVALWDHWQSTEPSLPAALVDRLQASSFDVADARRRLGL